MNVPVVVAFLLACGLVIAAMRIVHLRREQGRLVDQWRKQDEVLRKAEDALRTAEDALRTVQKTLDDVARRNHEVQERLRALAVRLAVGEGAYWPENPALRKELLKHPAAPKRRGRCSDPNCRGHLCGYDYDEAEARLYWSGTK